MPQNPITITDGTGIQVVTQIMNAMTSIACNYYGPTDPSTITGITVYPGFNWADSTTNQMNVWTPSGTWIPWLDLTTGNLLTNAATASLCSGNAATATNATNVTTNINGKPISSIFDTDGITALQASGATRFQISGNYDIVQANSVAGNSSQILEYYARIVPSGKNVYLKHATFHLNNSNFKLQVGTWTSTVANTDDETPNISILSGNGNLEYITVGVYNTSSSATGTTGEISWWLDLSIQ